MIFVDKQFEIKNRRFSLRKTGSGQRRESQAGLAEGEVVQLEPVKTRRCHEGTRKIISPSNESESVDYWL